MISKEDLRESYNKVGDKTWLYNDFLKENLDKSRNLFESTSLELKSPIPKKLDVIAILSGLPFPIEFQRKIILIQKQIKNIIQNNLVYFVEPSNLGIEYYVFKWPDDKELGLPKLKLCKEIFFNLVSQYKSFDINVEGIQINPDGCIILKTFPIYNDFFNMRELIKNSYPYSSSRKQSEWMHIPLGRILVPLGSKTFRELKEYVFNLNNFMYDLKITMIHLIHENRWYMTEKKYLYSSKLNS